MTSESKKTACIVVLRLVVERTAPARSEAADVPVGEVMSLQHGAHGGGLAPAAHLDREPAVQPVGIHQSADDHFFSGG